MRFIFGPTIWSSKAAILALYLQLFGTKRWLRWTCYFALIIIFLFYWAKIPLAWVYCTPHNGATWDVQVLTNCSDIEIMGPTQGVVGVAADIFLLTVPLPIIYKLNLALRKRIGLAAVFLVGILYVQFIFLRVALNNLKQCGGYQRHLFILPLPGLLCSRFSLV